MSVSASDDKGYVPSEAIDLAHRGGLDWIPLYLDTIYKYFVDTYEKYIIQACSLLDSLLEFKLAVILLLWAFD